MDSVECGWYKGPLGMSYNIVTSNEHTLKARIWAFVLEKLKEHGFNFISAIA